MYWNYNTDLLFNDDNEIRSVFPALNLTLASQSNVPIMRESTEPNVSAFITSSAEFVRCRTYLRERERELLQVALGS